MNNDKVKQASDAALEHYFDWFEKMLTVSTGAFALLISLQSSFVPSHPKWLWMLQASWGALAGAVVSAAVVLFSRHQLFLDLTNFHLQPDGPGKPQNVVVSARWYVGIAARVFPVALALAISFLAAFAIRNVGSQSEIEPLTTRVPSPPPVQVIPVRSNDLQSKGDAQGDGFLGVLGVLGGVVTGGIGTAILSFTLKDRSERRETRRRNLEAAYVAARKWHLQLDQFWMTSIFLFKGEFTHSQYYDAVSKLTVSADPHVAAYMAADLYFPTLHPHLKAIEQWNERHNRTVEDCMKGRAERGELLKRHSVLCDELTSVQNALLGELRRLTSFG